jgi:putative DNA methylase
VPLVRSFWLCNKKGKEAWIDPQITGPKVSTAEPEKYQRDGYGFSVRVGAGTPRAGTVGRTGATCLLTGAPIPLEYVRNEGRAGRIGQRLMAIVAEGRNCRLYLSPDSASEMAATIEHADEHLLDTDLPKEALGFRVQNYGMTKHRHLFTSRQLKTLAALCDLVTEARKRVADVAGMEYADAVATYLGFAVSKLADRCSSLCGWDIGYVKIGHVFGRHTLSMVWDFAEGNPFSDSTGNFGSTVDWVAEAVEPVPCQPPGIVRQANAADLKLPSGSKQKVMLSTDPPYYDNVPYADLSDFFYVWLRRSLKDVYPETLGTLLVPKAEELVAEPFRHGGRDAACAFFESGMTRVFDRARQMNSDDVPATVYYAFKQTEEADDDSAVERGTNRASTGWETFLQSLASVGWHISGTWPMRTELATRMRGQRSNALASSIVLSCRPRPTDAPLTTRREFLNVLKRELPDALKHLQRGNIAPVDLAQAAIGPGMAVFTRYAKVMEADGSPMKVRQALALINQTLDEVLAEQEGEFDGDTRWALAWFEQHSMDEGAFGVAETLSKAKNTAVNALVEAGIVQARSGKVRLLKRDELPANWNPADDTRLRHWEVVQHLIRTLEAGGETAAADLLRRVGGMGEVARDLAYRLYNICERKGWSSEGQAYNGLVTAWPEITKLAQSAPPVAPRETQGEIF